MGPRPAGYVQMIALSVLSRNHLILAYHFGRIEADLLDFLMVVAAMIQMNVELKENRR